MKDFNFYDIPQFARQRSKDFTPAKLQGCHLIVATPVVTGSAVLKPASPNYKSWTLTALDADTTLAFPHGFVNQAGTGIIPDFAILQELVSYANAALPNWGVAVDATNITVTKTAATASGGATPGTTVVAKVYAMVPSTIIE